MAWQCADRIKETTTTTGTGAITLGGAMLGFRAFSSVCSVGDTAYYALQGVDANGNPTAVWEVGIGTYSAASTLTRTTVLASSNANAAVTLAGTTQVWMDAPAAILAAALPSLALDDNDGFVDGNFDSWQLATSFSLAAATDTYTADMWVCNAGTGGAATVSQNAPTPGSEPAWVVTPRRYRLSYQQTTSATAAGTIGQKMESSDRYSGQTITVSATLAAAAAATLVTGIRVTQNFGSGGSPSASVVTTQAVSWAIGTAEARYSASIAVPSVSGKTLGTTAGTDYTRVDLVLATGVTFTLYASQLQIDPTPANLPAVGLPQPFRWRGYAVETARVMRHYEVQGGYVSTVIGNGMTRSTTAAYFGWKCVPKRAIAAVSSTAYSTFAILTSAGPVTPTAIASITATSPQDIFASITGTFTAGLAAMLQPATSTPYGQVFIDARL
jgi:hypothetical protein